MAGKCPSFIVARFENGTERIDDGSFVNKPHYIGNSILLYGRRADRFPYHAMIGPDWPCMLVTYALIVVPTVFFIYDVGSVVGWWVILLGTISGLSVLM
jgi:hypothetical protein